MGCGTSSIAANTSNVLDSSRKQPNSIQSQAEASVESAAAALGRSAPRLPEDDGKSYEVFSASAGGWVPCKVEERDEDQVRVSYESQVRLPTLHIDLTVCLYYL